MANTNKTPAQIAQQYLTWLKGLKPEVNISQTDSDWWIRAQVLGGIFSGIYADLKKISNDAFPQSARREAVEKHLNFYFGSGFTQPTVSEGTATVTGAPGSVISSGVPMEYSPNGNLYTTTSSVTIDGSGTAIVEVVSANTGQDQNLLQGAQLTLTSPPPGIDSTATVISISDGRDVETTEQAVNRILRQVRTPIAGGKESDYEAFALAADPSVVSANIIRFAFGFGTVGVVITAGTTDIDEALDNDYPVNIMPSPQLIERVQDYIETVNPLTDCATVIAPASVPIDCVINVRYMTGNNSTILSGQTLTQEQLVQREVKRAIYKTPVGGRKFNSIGYVVASEIEEMVDMNLGAEPYGVGNYVDIITDRQVEPLSATGYNRQLMGNEAAVPGIITVVEM